MLLGQGFITGLVLALMVGPITMTILHFGISVSKTGGFLAAAGTWTSDLVLITLTFWLTQDLEAWTHKPGVETGMHLIGGVGLIGLGLFMAQSRTVKQVVEPGQVGGKYLRAYIAGFLVNSMSPFSLLFWLGTAAYLHMQSAPAVWYYVGLMSALVILDSLKAWIAPKLAIWVKANQLRWVQIVAGLVVAGTGGYILVLGFMP